MRTGDENILEIEAKTNTLSIRDFFKQITFK